MTSKSHVRAAFEFKELLERQLAEIMADPQIESLEADIANLDNATKQYVIEHYGEGEGYEDDDWKATKVVGHRRSWNVDTLEKVLPRALFKRVITISVDGSKVDQLVRDKKIDRKKIARAYEEVANAPYVKVTKKVAGQLVVAQAEAEGLAEKLA